MTQTSIEAEKIEAASRAYLSAMGENPDALCWSHATDAPDTLINKWHTISGPMSKALKAAKEIS